MPEEPDEAEPRKDDGLDLARQLTRATAKSTPAARKRRTRRDDRPRDAKVSGAHPDDRDPQLLGSQLDRLVADQGWEIELRVRGVFARWPDLVGAEVGAHCSPESFVDGKLTVRTDSTAWATQLRLMSSSILGRLEAEVGKEAVSELRVNGPGAPSWSRGSRRAQGPGPRDTYG